MTELRYSVSDTASAMRDTMLQPAPHKDSAGFAFAPGQRSEPVRQRLERALVRWPEPIVTEGHARSRTRGLSGEDIQIFIHSDQVGGRFSLIHHYIAPGRWSLLQRYEECDLLLTVLAGDIELACNGDTTLLPLHASVAIARDSQFGWHNAGKVEARLAATYFQGGHEQLLRAALHCCDIEELQYIARTYGVHLASRTRPFTG